MPTSEDFSQHVKEVMNRNNIQIRSLEFVDSELKEKFFTQRKKAILLIANKVFEREINSLANRTLEIFDTQLNRYLKKGQLVLVVLPTGGKKRYVLQTKIVNIFIDRFQLIALDPRDANRFPFSSPIGVRIRPVCDATAIRIQTGEVRVIRYNDGVSIPPSAAPTDNSTPNEGIEKNLPAGVGGKGSQPPDSAIMATTSAPPGQGPHSSIKDMLCKAEGDDQADDFVKLAGQSPIDGTILDISCGGMCVSCEHGAVKTLFVDQLLAMECAVAKDPPLPDGGAPLDLFVFAIVRNKKEHQDATQLNLQFLANLPKAVVELVLLDR